MAESKNFVINVNGDDCVNISEEVVGIIAGLGAVEVDGVESLVGNLTSESISKAGQGKLAKAIRVVDNEPGKIIVRMAINMKYGYEIPKVSGMVQEKVKSAVETMTGLEVTAVDVRIATVSVASTN
ncbi:Asp23/Gls24 family envelope stress response protein [Pseudobutyrivibrio sp. MD2005]|uniref:Asp23/Gls24 family envelope stress response protein n=1 Tax=Pseudobutyrivibrio sp. MD2005 TaxID=1410616 RepID=UPI000483D069|nr:Asp23/Gls24 family envelope stress response protein [Pseudobutyrivibrio sp. MD2005]